MEENATPEKQFELRLWQKVGEVQTESMTVSAENETVAQNLANEWAKTKDLEDGKYRFEIVDVTPEPEEVINEEEESEEA